MIYVVLGTIILSISVSIVSLTVLFYPQEKRQKHKNEAFEKKWIDNFVKQSSEKTWYYAKAAFENKLGTKEIQYPLIKLTDKRLLALTIVISLIIALLQLGNA